MSAASNETTRETTTFDFFGRTWTVPTKARYTHLEMLQANPSDIGITRAFLGNDDLNALREIDPDVAELDKFTDAIVKAVGLSSAGN